MRICFFLGVLLVSISSYAEDGARCAERALPQERCDQMRQRALDSNCISREKYNSLAFNHCPLCDDGLYMGWCLAGCFKRGTKILVSNLKTGIQQWEVIEEVVAHKELYQVLAIANQDNEKRPVFRFFPIKLVVHGPEAEPLVMIKTENGKELGLTSQHGVLLDSGKMVLAELLVVGDRLLDIQGNPIRITSIERSMTNDDVFNILLDAENKISHTVIAENIIVGDQYWQSVSLSEFNATIFER